MSHPQPDSIVLGPGYDHGAIVVKSRRKDLLGMTFKYLSPEGTFISAVRIKRIQSYLSRAYLLLDLVSNDFEAFPAAVSLSPNLNTKS